MVLIRVLVWSELSMSSEHHGEPNGESEIPMWVYLTAIGLFTFTILCFGVMLAGMVFV